MTFLILFFGLLFGFRILVFCERDFKKQSIIMTKFGTIVFLVIVLKQYLNATRVLFLVIGVLFLCFTFLMCQKSVAWFHRQKLKDELQIVLNEIILRMQSGSAFRNAFLRTIDEQKGKTQKLWREIYEIVTFSQQFSMKSRSNFENQMLKEFNHINSSSENSLKLLVSYRYRLNLDRNFRHRSGAITRQIRLQSIIMSVLYCFLMVFTLRHFSYRENWPLFLLSNLLFMAGLAVIFLSGRRIQWNL